MAAKASVQVNAQGAVTAVTITNDGPNPYPVIDVTPDAQIKRWQQIKEHLTTQNKAFSDYCKPFKDEQEQIEAWLLNFLNETKQNSAKCESGTAYKSTLTQPKIVDRTAYLDWALEHWDGIGNEMFQIAAPQVGAFEVYMEGRKTDLEAYVKEHGGQLPDDPSVTPPGTEVNYFTRVNIRKT